MTNKNGICRLCGYEAKICNSHVIPEFFYEQMQLYGKKHRFHVLSTDQKKHGTVRQKGVYEKLLCAHCESKLSVWEQYARDLLYGPEPPEFAINSPKGVEIIVDYRKLKLFQLSIIWRVGVSMNEAFSSIHLYEHEKVLRGMLLAEEPGNTVEYGCLIVMSSAHQDITSNMIHCIGMSEIDGVKCASLMLGGLFWTFFLSQTEIDPRQRALFLQESGHLRILKTDKDPNLYIESLAKNLHSANPPFFDRFNL